MNDEIKTWLKQTGRDRAWLAEQCGVSIGTVNNWLSAGRKITGPPQKIIEQLMSATPKLNPQIDLETFLKFEAIARREGKTVEEKIADLMKEALKKGLHLFIFGLFVAQIALDHPFTARLRARSKFDAEPAEVC
jgi:hypothetical protein